MTELAAVLALPLTAAFLRLLFALRCLRGDLALVARFAGLRLPIAVLPMLDRLIAAGTVEIGAREDSYSEDPFEDHQVLRFGVEDRKVLRLWIEVVMFHCDGFLRSVLLSATADFGIQFV